MSVLLDIGLTSISCGKSPSGGDSKFVGQPVHGLKNRTYPRSLPKITSRLQKVDGVRYSKSNSSLRSNARDRSHGVLLEESYPESIKTLLLDNYDSYTYNLYQQISVINGVAPVVLRNNEISWDDLYRLLYEERAFHNVVISPGPGSPTRASDVGICMQLLQKCHDIPILGVCLGHQALGCVHGARIVHAPEPVHGRLSEIEHSGHPLFAGIPSGVNSGFKVVRYHSLMIDAGNLPEDLVPTAWTITGSGLMGLDAWHGGLQMPNATFLSEDQLLQEKISSDRKRLPEVVADGQLSFEDIAKPMRNKGGSKVLMGISHRMWPHHGVQFHPESVATTYGNQILVNFRKITVEFWEEHPWQLMGNRKKIPSSVDIGPCNTVLRGNRQATRGPGSLFMLDSNLSNEGKLRAQLKLGHSRSAAEVKKGIAAKGSNPQTKPGAVEQAGNLRLHWEKLPGFATRTGGSKTLFCKLFGEEAVEDTFWLDSATQEQGRARFSFMGGRGGSLWQRITYHVPDKSMVAKQGGILKVHNAVGQAKETVLQEGFLDLLNRELELRRCKTEDYADLPFDFCGGFIGYLGYELKIECGAESNQHRSSIPDAGMFLADQVVVIDHMNDDVYVLALFQEGNSVPLPGSSKDYPDYAFTCDGGSSCSSQEIGRSCAGHAEQERCSRSTSLLEASYIDGLKNGQILLAGEGRCGRRAAEAWVEELVRKIKFLAQQDLHIATERMHHVSVVSSVPTTGEDIHPPFVAEKSKSGYIKDVERCQEFIKDGESYEVCLTTRLRRKVPLADCLGLYLTLRETNPAPYAAWLHFGKDGPCICSSSPERFLLLDRKGVLEAKPIKGTVARGNTPSEDERFKYELQHSEKDQAENLMIVDLLRNDLGRVCEPGTVHVPSLMAVESYSTVHTLVSTVRGRKRPDVTPMDCVRAAFPGGSMTGAPKLRTMEIIDSLESSPRGVYSGTIGYFSFNSSFDLNIVIRTLVIHEGEASLGAGGAVIALSNPAGEYEEMLLKTKAPIRAVSKYENDLKASNAAEQRGSFYL